MTRDVLASREVQPLSDGEVVSVAFLKVAVPGGEMGSEEAEGCVAVVETDRDGSL